MQSTPDDGWRVRLATAEGRICGAGVLVAPDLVLTCAHVAARAAAHGPAATGPPAGPLVVQFATASDVGTFAGTVLADHWVPAADDHSGDLALVTLDRAAPIDPAVLGACGPPRRRTVKIFGHPGGNRLGRWAIAEIRGTAGPSNEWVQLNDLDRSGPRIAPGFSGAGVIDEATGRVIGIVVGSDSGEATRGAWMIAVEAIAGRLRSVAPLVVAAPDKRDPVAVADPVHTAYERALVETLSGLPRISERGARDELVWAVDRVAGTQLGFDRSDRTRADLLALIAACLDHPSGNLLPALGQALGQLHGGHPAVRRFTELLAQDTGRRLSGHEVQQLAALVAELPSDTVDREARVAFGPLGPTPGVSLSNPTHLVRALTRLIGAPGNPPPLLNFLRSVADKMPSPGPARFALLQWFDRLADRWQIELNDHHADRAGDEMSTPLRSALVINLREDGPDPQRFLLSIWLQQETARGVVGRGLLTDDDQPVSPDEVPGRLGVHLRAVLEQAAALGPLTIEFVVPSRLFMTPLDLPHIYLSGPAQPLGAAHPVVLRSMDRLSHQAIHHRWRTRWRWLVEHRDAADPRATKFVEVAGAGRRVVEDELQNDPDYTTEVPVCLVLAAGHRQRQRTDTVLVTAVREALELGMPVLLWCRNPRLNQQFLVQVSNRLHGRPIAELPSVVQQMRREAALHHTPQEHVGSHLSLLWDDAERLPSGSAFRAPLGRPEGEEPR